MRELATFFAALLWFTWMFSSLITYWGARKTAQRVLLFYGGAWMLFNILDEFAHPMALLMQSLLTVPFFLGAWLSRKWPRIAGAFLLAAAVVLFILIGRLHLARGFALVVSAITLLLFVGPLVASGIALLARPGEDPPTTVDEELP